MIVVVYIHDSNIIDDALKCCLKLCKVEILDLPNCGVVDIIQQLQNILDRRLMTKILQGFVLMATLLQYILVDGYIPVINQFVYIYIKKM